MSYNFGLSQSAADSTATPKTTITTSVATTSTSAAAFSLIPPTTTKTPIFNTPSTSVTTKPAVTVGLSFAQPANTTISTASITSSSATLPQSSKSLTFAQLEDSINKWTLSLEDQGKFFINQAKQLNAWDSYLISNGEKLVKLSDSIGRVKEQQGKLCQELDFVLAQQKELEELIVSLEKELVDNSVVDPERNQTYHFAEVIDSQLKQISDDLKEVVENINESIRINNESVSPLTQISKILNAHTNSLQWIDENIAEIGSHLKEISKIEETNRKSFNLDNSFFKEKRF